MGINLERVSTLEYSLSKDVKKVLKFAVEVKVIDKEKINHIVQDAEQAEDILLYLCDCGFLKELLEDGIEHMFGSAPRKVYRATGEYRALPLGEAYIENFCHRWAVKWVPYIITTLIAAAALVNSVLARLC